MKKKNCQRGGEEEGGGGGGGGGDYREQKDRPALKQLGYFPSEE